MNTSRPTNDQLEPPSAHAPRPARSKNGCLTCRRRKVRCDEQRPRCSHCERLNLQCRWRPPPSAPQWRFVGTETGTGQLSVATGPDSQAQPQEQAHPSPDGSHASAPVNPAGWLQNPGAVDQLFDYASFMWDAGGEGTGQESFDRQRMDSTAGREWTDSFFNPNQPHSLSALGADATSFATAEPRSTIPTRPHPSHSTSHQQASRAYRSSASQLIPAEDHDLIDYFARSVVPPILAEVETQKRWSSMRQMLISMSNASAMVRNAILAFSVLIWYRQEASSGLGCPSHHYQNAVANIEGVAGDISSVIEHTSQREHLLAALFFLSYIDILEDRMDSAIRHLKRAFQIFQQGNKRGFRPVEVRLLSWIRLLDARAVSAGGEGLFLSDNSEALIVHPSPAPASVDETPRSESHASTSARDEVKEWDIEDVLFQVLYQPGIVFFQKVQSFMGRISKIDPWHRSRGTVEDETDVMRIAARILQDLRGLYDDRPTLMDHAVDGRLTAPHVSPHLAMAITRAFRTYLSNYHASKVHLHRVAYRDLPLTKETTDALRRIRDLTRLMVDSLEPEAALPVSQLWPLLMLGSEEKDPAERAWIREQILRMEKVATNASITAQVLEEVQARQDASGSRVDIRAVMHAVFDSCFAIM